MLCKNIFQMKNLEEFCLKSGYGSMLKLYPFQAKKVSYRAKFFGPTCVSYINLSGSLKQKASHLHKILILSEILPKYFRFVKYVVGSHFEIYCWYSQHFGRFHSLFENAEYRILNTLFNWISSSLIEYLLHFSGIAQIYIFPIDIQCSIIQLDNNIFNTVVKYVITSMVLCVSTSIYW